MSGSEWLNLNMSEFRYEVGYKSTTYAYMYVYHLTGTVLDWEKCQTAHVALVSVLF